MLVRFRDILDPMTVEEVDPSDLAASFGPGNALRRITVEIIKDPLTRTIGERLPWLGEHPEPRLPPYWVDVDKPTLPELLAHGDFRYRMR